jgi:4-amino-4-deoxy-L-arabinose transferase-like glycosyltransferase
MTLRRDLLATPIASGLIFLIYAFSMSLDIGFWDTGEMQTVPFMLGLAHPTGYPAEILLGWVFTHLVPIGDPAIRMNLFCAICVVGSTAACCELALSFGASPLISALCAMCYGLTPVVWEHATHTDVTDPAILFCASSLLFASYAAKHDKSSFLYSSALCAGLAMGTHGIVIFFLPAVFVVLVSSRHTKRPEQLATYVGIMALVVVAEYAYLPLRSWQVTAQSLDPTRAIGLPVGMSFWDHGHPMSLAGFLTIVTGSPVHAASSLGSIWRVSDAPRFLAASVEHLRANYPSIVLASIGVFAILSIVVNRRSWVLLIPLALVTPFAATFSQETDVSRYFSFPILCLWVLCAVAVTALGQFSSSRWIVATLPALPLAMLAYELYSGRYSFAQPSDRVGRTYVAEILRSTPGNAIIVAPWVYATPLAYMAYAKGAFGNRILVPFDVGSAEPYLSAWLASRPVYAVSEARPPAAIRSTERLRFHVNPDIRHDPRLFFITGLDSRTPEHEIDARENELRDRRRQASNAL